MTGVEMISSFLQLYDYVTSMNAPGYNSTEILLFLNNAQDEFIKDRMFGKNFQPPAFEQNQKRVADLQTLIVSPLTIVLVGSPGSYNERTYTWSTPAPNYLYYLESISLITRSNHPVISSGEWIVNKFINHANIGKFINSTINKTIFLHPVAWIEGNSLKVMGDQYTTISATNGQKLSYIKKPSAITNSSSELTLPPHTHQEIVELAVRAGLVALGDPRWQAALIEHQNKTT